MTKQEAVSTWIEYCPEHELQILLEEIIEQKMYSIKDGFIFSKNQEKTFLKIFAQRKTGTPLPYIFKKQSFFGRDFFVSPDVLIPRPDTEYFVEQILKIIKSNNISSVLDLGTGSGCIAITLKKESPKCHVSAVDISPAALEIAQKNAKTHKTEINFFQSDLLASISDIPELLVANLPYVETSWKDPSIAQEPDLALYSGADGLDHYRRLALELTDINIKHILLEFGPQQTEEIKKIFAAFRQQTFFQYYDKETRFVHLTNM
ncbi:protein-(glutamine-N5) methyltransferase, release factor-specific [Candidatus Peregrinibacteria bacterium]|nr:MAG: protein-(glutamine-N5) methyltransferase, release factor-specific [Candidatus Peregrinibacteria bacterium]